MCTSNRMKELYWAAGFFDGEGHTAFEVSATSYIHGRIRMQIGNTFKPTIDRFQKAVDNIGIISKSKCRSGKDFWVWSTTSAEDVEKIFEMLSPALSEEKLEQAADAIASRYCYRKDRIIKNNGRTGKRKINGVT